MTTDLLADRFELQSLAGNGGMAEVFRAVDRQDGARVAVKRATKEALELLRGERYPDGVSVVEMRYEYGPNKRLYVQLL